MQDTTASAVFRQLRAAPADPAAHAAQLDLVRRLVDGQLELHLPRKARARALLEWAAGRCAIKEGSNTPSAALDAPYWSLFAQILTLKDDSSPSASNSSTFASEESNLLSKSDIRQIAIISRGISLLNALKSCLESIPSLLVDTGSSLAGSASGSIHRPNDASNLLEHLFDAFQILFPLSLSSPTTTLDGFLPCIHAYIRSSGAIASIAASHQNVLLQWNKLGQLLSQTLSSLTKSSNSTQDTSANERLLLKKVASSFLDQANGCSNWKAFTSSYDGVSQLLKANVTSNSATGKGKGKARDVSYGREPASLSKTSIADSGSVQENLEALLALLDNFIKTAVFSHVNLARYFSASSGTSLDTPKQAQESLSELFNTFKASIRSSDQTLPGSLSESNVSILPGVMSHYIETLSSHSHDLFAPSKRTRIAGDAASGNVTSSAAASRSAVEYQVQTCFRNAVFGMLQGLTQLLRDALTVPSTLSINKKSSPLKRQREAHNDGANVLSSRTTAVAFKHILAQVQEKNIYISGGAQSNREWLRILQDAAHFVVKDLLPNASRTEVLDAVTTVAAMQAATSIAKMDYTAMEEVLSSLLQAMTTTVTGQQALFATACGELLDTAISYKGKVRQLNGFIEMGNESLSAVINQAAASSEDTSSFIEKMDNVFKTPLLSRHTSARFSKECKTSLPATQAIPLLRRMLESIRENVLALKQTNGETETVAQPPKKKSKSGRNSTGGSSSSTMPQSRLPWQVYASVHIMQCILSGNKAASMIGSDNDGFEELEVLVSSTISQAIDFNAIQTANSAEQLAAAAILQLQNVWSSFNEKPPELAEAASSSLLDALQVNDTALPALKFEIIRTLLSQATSSFAGEPGTIRILDSITVVLNSAQDTKGAYWDGYVHDMSPEQLPTALWYLVSGSYIDVIDQSATEQQLGSIVEFISSQPLGATPNEDSNISIPAITQRLLHSADFFELLRIRESMTIRVGELCDSGSLQKKHLDVLVLLPVEYLNRTLRRKIVSTLASQTDAVANRLNLLAFLKFTKDDAGQPLLKDTTFLLSLAQHQQSEAEPLLDRLYEQLWRLMLQNWSASPESFAALPSLLERLATFNSTDKKGLNLLTWRVLAHEAKIASIPTEVQSHLRAQVDTLEKSAFDSEGEQSQIYMKLAYCNVAQVVKEWMNLEQASSKHNEYANLAKAAISSLLQQNPHYTQEQQGKTAYMALELASMNISPPLLNFETFVVSFWLLSQRLDMTDRQYSSLLARAAASQPDEAYKAAVSAMSEAVSASLSDDAFAAAIQVLAILVCNSPDAGARIASQTFSASLRRISLLYEGRSLASGSPLVLQSITAYIKTFLEQKIGVPELQDVAVIWTILHDIFTPTSTTGSAGPGSSSIATGIFINAIEIMSLIATHRRDHVIPTFAQFSRVLSDVLLLLRLSGASPSSGQKSLESTFPLWTLAERGRWILDPRCSKAVTRLLLGLGTRTTVLQRSSVRARGASTASVVALTGPLSKHAPFIVLNYLTAATDSRFALSSSIRKEINAGILEIISTMGKSERESLMKAYLQADQEAERALLRVMWKEFDAVRYKGD